MKHPLTPAQIQQSIWRMNLHSKTILAETAARQIESRLSHPTWWRQMPVIGQWAIQQEYGSVARLVNLGAGWLGIFKAPTPNNPNGPLREVAAYRIAREYGFFVPVTVMTKINGAMGSMQLFMEGMPTAQPAGEKTGAEFSRNVMTRVFDALMANADRIPQNVLLDGHGREILIDNESAFGRASFLHLSAAVADSFRQKYPEITARLMNAKADSHARKELEGLAAAQIDQFFNRLNQFRKMVEGLQSGKLSTETPEHEYELEPAGY